MSLWHALFTGVPICLGIWGGVSIWRYNHRPLTVGESGAELAADLFVHQSNRFSHSNGTYHLDRLRIKWRWVEVRDGPNYRKVTIEMDGVDLPTDRGAAKRILAHLDHMEFVRKEEASAEAARKVARAVIDLQGVA